MENSDPELPKVYKIRKTLLQMLFDRGYDVDEKEIEEPFETWRLSFKDRKNSLCILQRKRDDNSQEIYVEYSEDLKLGVSHITRFAEKLVGQNIPRGILIIKGGISPIAKQVKFYFINYLEN
jgi:DNA-directed RNA polymerase I, II, and III subunit RPABC1